MSGFVILGIVAALMIFLFFARRKYKKQGIENGDIIEREKAFWEDEEVLFTTASYEDILSAIKKTDFRKALVTITPNINGQKVVLFQNKTFGFNAILQYNGKQNNEHEYVFCFPSWTTRNYTVPGEGMMNILMTTVEKMFLILDPDTEAEVHRMKATTKTRFI